ncbi:hypothetical protein ABGV42_00470 [Paenibacillus pabuli]|uniref:hypothetical protein n=1 Tax=Paenibacillus pabuli TaxID=1472 RepID=UPI003241CAF9
MFRYLIIRNFQSIKELILRDLDYGAIALKGENEIGKGSFRKSIEALFTDIAAVHMKYNLRHGASSIYIEAGLMTGNVVKRSFGAEKYSYMFDENGTLIADDMVKIREHFNLYYDEQSKQLLNIRRPEDPLIGVYTSPMQNFKIIQQALGTQVLTQDVARAKADMLELEKSVKDKSSQILELRNDLRNIPDITIDTSEAEREFEAEMDILDKMEQAIELLTDLENADVPDVPEIDIYDWEQELQIIEKMEQVLQMETELQPLDQTATRLTSYLQGMDVVIGELEQEIQILETIEQLQGQVASLERLEESNSELTATVKELSEIVQEAELLLEIDQHICTFQDIRKISAKYKELHAEHAAIGERRETLMKTNKFCPVVAETNSCPFSVDVSQLVRI